MKTTIKLLFLLLFVRTASIAQTAYDKIPVKTEADCKAAEPKVIEAANLMLASPLHSDDKQVMEACKFIIAWMSGTPDFSFTLDDKITKLSDDKNVLMLGFFMACESKFALENRDKTKDEKEFLAGAYSLLAQYCMDEKNGVDMTKPVKKLMDAYKDGKMKEYVKK